MCVETFHFVKIKLKYITFKNVNLSDFLIFLYDNITWIFVETDNFQCNYFMIISQIEFGGSVPNLFFIPFGGGGAKGDIMEKEKMY